MSKNSENEWIIDKDFDGHRIDYWLKKIKPNLSYPIICKIIRKGQIKVNKRKVKNSFVVHTGDRVNLFIFINHEKEKNLNIGLKLKFAEEIKKWVIFKNDEFIALNKPSGIAVQGGTNIKLNIDMLLDSLKYELKERPKLIHRIDKNTSGLLLIARNLKSAKFFGEIFRERKIKKKYLLLVKGLIKDKIGEIKIPIITNKKENSATTNYTLITYFNKVSLVLASPLTGRKHQIRKHFSMIGHPILGDKRFGLTENSNFFLHSYYTEFKSEKKILIKLIAPIPDYFKEAISRMNVNFDKIEDKIKILL